jgi:hypothetical protein
LAEKPNALRILTKLFFMKIISTLFILLVAVLFSLSLSAQNWNQESKQTADVRAANDNFGQSVAIDGNFAIIGANQEDEDVLGENTLNNAGAAFIYKNDGNGWAFYQKIVATDRNTGDFFGASVDIDGDYIVVGAYQEDENASGSATMSNTGSAYIFKNIEGTWTQIQKICASDRFTDDYFGYSIGISGDFIAVGAYQEDEDEVGANPQEKAGSVYIFRNNEGTWEETQKLVASDRSAADYLGCSLSIDGTNLVVGAYLEDENATGSAYLNNSGSAYVFSYDGSEWSQEKKLVANDRGSEDFFGFTVSISGDFIAIGAYQEDESSTGTANMPNAGSAYIFKNNAGTWSQFAKLTASDRDDGDQYGFSVSLYNNYLVVSATLEDEDAVGNNTYFNAGSAYVYEFDNNVWQQVQKIVPADRATTDAFGNAVAMGNYSTIVTANMEDHDLNGENFFTNSGSAYFFKKSSWMEVSAAGTKYPSGSTIDFGYAVAGQNSTSRDFVIYNDGGDTIELSSIPAIELLGANMSEYIVNQTEIITILAPGESTSFSVDFNPAATGDRVAFINIANNTAVNPFVFNFTGTGTTNSIISSDESKLINIFPNPTCGTINISSEHLQINKITIVDITGKTILCQQNSDDTAIIDMSNFENGVYFILIEDQNAVYTGRFVKE